jgi:hypothetical protein
MNKKILLVLVVGSNREFLVELKVIPYNKTRYLFEQKKVLKKERNEK